ALEESNVDVTAELIDMIQVQRFFQANAQVVGAADELTQTIINII
ncbi:MAG: flagellar hook protein FlgE, partial [Leptospiraceae bacterium]|nr:flagellar hook protein FlgE [Leptospiraceae bacterium]